MIEKIKLYIVSGFLGAGKTTLLKRMLSQLPDKKLGVIINEFGSIGVDGQTISREGLQLVEVNNGSIFCSCLKVNFTQTLVAMQKEDIEILIIENSGLADPSAMNKLLREMTPYMERGYDYQGSICIVDATTFLDYVDVLMPVENQILASDLIAVNKTDLTDTETIRKIEERINKININAYIIRTVQADVSIELMHAQLKNGGAEGELTSCSWNSPESYTIDCKGMYARDALKEFLTRLSEYAARIKGFVQTRDGWMHVDVVGNQIGMYVLEDANDEIFVRRGLVILGKTEKPFYEQAKMMWEELMGEKDCLTIE